MDLVTQRKLVQLLWGPYPDDEPLRFFWERQRELSWNRPAFITVAMRVANEIFLAELNDRRNLDKSFRHVLSRVNILSESYQHLRRPRFCSIKDFFNDNPDTFLASVVSLAECRSFIWSLPSLQPEPSGSPPKGFIPLPDAEIGGCARNDSLIAPAIN
ncbi:hypothetical protein QUB61_36885 [Microcoleus sp. C2D2]